MSTDKNDRDIKFQGFARLLYDELTSRPFELADLPYEDWLKLLIAQRAYDLAVHVMSHTSEWVGTELEVDFMTPQEAIRDYVPDLTQWPESPTE